MSAVKTVSIHKLRPGMRIAKAIENSYGAILVSPGMIANENTIRKLKNIGINKVDIILETDEQIEKNKNDFAYDYSENVKSIKKVFKLVGKGRDVDFNEIKKIVDKVTGMETNRDIVTMLSQIRDVDDYTFTHSINVGLLAMIFGRWVNLKQIDSRMLLYAGLLHDIGKACIPRKILNKEDKLTPEEFNKMKKHSIEGYKLVRKCRLLPNRVARAVLMHHERNDESGYPFGFGKDKIPFMARVLGIIDTFDAITSDRVYKEHRAPFTAFQVFEKDLKSFDIHLARIFMSNISQYYLGENVKLNNGLTGVIVYINPNHLSRPIIRVNDKYIDLYRSELEIEDFFVDYLPGTNNIKKRLKKNNNK